jgi:hypothetical protein
MVDDSPSRIAHPGAAGRRATAAIEHARSADNLVQAIDDLIDYFGRDTRQSTPDPFNDY